LSARIALADEKMTLGICGSHNRPRHFVFTFDSSSTQPAEVFRNLWAHAQAESPMGGELLH